MAKESYLRWMMRRWRSLLFPVLGMPFTVQMAWRVAFEMAGTWMVRMRLCTSADLSAMAWRLQEPKK